MSSPILSTTPDTLACEAVNLMQKKLVSSLLVEDNNQYIGIFTKTNWVHLVLQEECDPNQIKVSSLMSSPIVTIDKNESLLQASALIEMHSIRHLAVKDKNEIVGILSVKDLERYYFRLHQKDGIAQYGC